MSTFRTPVGPQAPTVYWRRRLLVALGVVAVIVIIILIIVRPGSTPAADKSPTPGPTTSAATPPSSAGSDTKLCDPSVIEVVAKTDAATYKAGVNPMLSATITNTGSKACTFDVGTAAQEYVITSGKDRIWSSKDCQTAAESTELELKPNTPQTTEPFAWDRTRSSAGTCDGERTAAVANASGPTYKLQVSFGKAESKLQPFQLFG
ncbi:MAG TPA: hypothetical protein VNT53_03900 [Pseudolysinimonas sp.]|nr:hypothetical protein [Pseudolysinimonas sp.]